MARYRVNYNGLKKKQSYEELIDYLQHGQEKIKLPNRRALQLRNSPELAFLDGEGVVEMEQQQMKRMHHEEKSIALQKAASNQGITHQELKAELAMEASPIQAQDVNIPDNDNDFQDALDEDLHDEVTQHVEKRVKIHETAQQHLEVLEKQSTAQLGSRFKEKGW